MRWMAVAYAFYTPPKPISASCGEWLTAARDLALEAGIPEGCDILIYPYGRRYSISQWQTRRASAHVLKS